MERADIKHLLAFLAVARERSFTRAAAKLGMSQSALSHTVRGLEARMGMRLLTRTTRSVAPTEAGERLLRSVGPHFEEIEAELLALTELRDKPAGTIRITTVEHAAETILWPGLKGLLASHPDIHLEISADYGLKDLVAEGFHAGVRLGNQVADGMVAVRIGQDMQMTVVAAPSYFAKHPRPKLPKDLLHHRCIVLRLPTHGALYTWPFKKGRSEFSVRVEGYLVFNTLSQMVQAALDGFGLIFIPEDLARPYLASTQLVRVLDDWSPVFEGYHLYFPKRRQNSPAFRLVVDALRVQEPRKKVS
ncbi:MAG: LysR family transcriptional regulator [Stagnimonas sp.]|nr:LysR family transcriptional regulator [Stagnimonas sp.]